MKTDAEWQQFVDEAIERAFERFDQKFERIDERFSSFDERFERIDERFERIDKRFSNFDEKFEKFERKFDQRLARMEKRWDRKAIKVAEDAAIFVYEKMKDDFALTNEATGFIKEQLEQQVDRQEFDDLAADNGLNRLAVTATNRDVGRLKVRVGKLEND